MKIHHAIIKAVEAIGCEIMEEGDHFILTNRELETKAMSSDPKELRKLAQQWDSGENIEDYVISNDELDPSEEDDELEPSGVVPDKYKTLYKEQGHPNTCGDWLANVLAEFTVSADGFDRAAFVTIIEMNGITDWQKYLKGNPRSDNGQLRMNCANRLRKIVRNTGYLVTPKGNLKLK